MNDKYDFQTRTIHPTKTKNYSEHSLNPPIYQTSTFTFDKVENAKKVMNFENNDYIYTRGNNPTLRLLEEIVCSLENAKAAVTFSSGMAAISSVLLSLTKPHDTIIAHKTLYGSAHSFISNLLKKYNINAIFVDLTKPDTLNRYLNDNVKAIYFETPSNPTLELIDIKAVSNIVKKCNIKVVVDNTFASPYFQNPLDLGADIVVHSATKYLNGHGDVVAGIALSNDENYINYLKFDYMCELGGTLNPFEAWLIIRGLKTLSLRMREHEKNAIELTKFLSNHPLVKKVYYPGLKNSKYYELAKKQMSGFGGVVSFELNTDKDTAEKIIDSLQLCKRAVSLGDAETLVEFPALMTHFMLTEQELAESGISPVYIRVSLGLEHYLDIIFDFKQAFEKVTQKR
jgi:methionine-gamma-lyase